MTPAVERLVAWCEALRAEGKLNPEVERELWDLMAAVRNEDPLSVAFERARARFRAFEGKDEDR